MSDFSDEDPALDFPETSSEEASSDEEDAQPLPPISSNYFAPPFYGRPPTPLPPSPSLTSLLRPSRPTTPDASDDELEPVPRAAPQVPTYEYYGFVLYLFSTLTFLVYLLWAYLPSAFLHAMGIYYYPNRWWALAIPAFLVMLIVYIYVALAAYNVEYLTLPLTDLETIVDDAANVATIDSKGRIRGQGRGAGPADEKGASKRHQMPARDLDWHRIWNRGTDAVMDVPLAGANEVLYGGCVSYKDEAAREASS
ncbi:PIG-P-domain-containing protein [Apiospora phragmitis]|uniref:PIG-P-domain-containing protein n=1 Tax=Apiospora phragmitis TaxID=2905665 RepID=A0ABR1V3Y8_9PEZI